MDNEASGKYLTPSDEQVASSSMIHHAHAAGIMGGFSVCGASGDICTDRLLSVDCGECVRRINYSFNRRNHIGAIDPSPPLESTWERISRGRIIGGKPKPQVRPLPESEHPGLNSSAFERLREKFGQSNG